MREKIVISDRGSLTIPSKIRRAFGIRANDELFVEQTSEGILLRPAISVPIEMYTEDRIAEFAREEKALGKKFKKAA